MKIKTQIFEKIDNKPNIGDSINISERNYHHLKNVLRLKNNDLIKIIINEKYITIGKVTEIKNSFSCEILEIKEESQTSASNITVCFAVCKASQNELVAEKLTELGIKNIYFWVSEHTSYKIADIKNKKERLEKIIEGAARQSKQVVIPRFEIFSSMKDMITNISLDSASILYCSLEDDRKKIKDLTNLNKNIFIFIGPEGDFSKSEYETLKSLPCSIGVTLGNTILKSETAAIVGAGIVMNLTQF